MYDYNYCVLEQRQPGVRMFTRPKARAPKGNPYEGAFVRKYETG